MKFSTIMVAFALAFAFASAGCRYNKAGSGSGADGAAGEGMDISSSQEGSLSDMSEGKFEDLYTRCTDVDFAPVYFGFDSTVVPQGEVGKIDQVASHLSEKTDRVVVIEGHCDERGSNEYNMPLGENRAIIIRNYLVQSGIAANRIQTRSFGEEKPAVDGHDEGAWSKNRRGEFAIYQK
jgi:peptidoglycan-associated lipoprotein